MVNLKKYNALLRYFVLILTVFSFLSCAEKKVYVSEITGKQLPVSETLSTTNSIESFIEPYRKHIDEDLNTVLAYAPENIDKKGEWQTKIGNLQSTITLVAANKMFQIRENKEVNICLLNNGGIRSVINKGNVTTRTAFELMPFENNLVVVSLKCEQILEMIDYIIKEKKPHPLAGLTFTIDKDNKSKNILIQNQPLDEQKVYNIATNDYLYNGGDNMNFFKKGIQIYDLDYKIRNIWVDYFKEIDTIPIVTDIRIVKEQ
ncbi:5'-nucleotidase C-terminal domain-containing protein [Flavobacterium sp.]|jgi:2',3'-cyclic-nucleotide 2'-phosphodiesterase (5'-nucleotidase family)|uniref:5'-nucleotidase C-terminal domain-containing protein n=1 Tax=Flavobacterium sp. TaxID=239 RepID=UPI0037BE430D